jgi:hypothetical protein
MLPERDRNTDADYHRQHLLGLWTGIVLACDLVGPARDAWSARRRLEVGVDGAAELYDGVPPRARSSAARVVLRGLDRYEDVLDSVGLLAGVHAGLMISLAVADDHDDPHAIRDDLDAVEDIVATIVAGRLGVAFDGYAATIRRELDRRRRADDEADRADEQEARRRYTYTHGDWTDESPHASRRQRSCPDGESRC